MSVRRNACAGWIDDYSCTDNRDSTIADRELVSALFFNLFDWILFHMLPMLPCSYSRFTW